MDMNDTWILLINSLILLIQSLILLIGSLYLLATGAKGLIEKKPFLIQSRWVGLPWYVVCYVLFLRRLTEDNHYELIFQMLLIVVAVLYAMRRPSYTFFGVTDTSFREALHAALAAKSISFEDELFPRAGYPIKIHLKDQNMDLEFLVKDLLGTGRLTASKGGRLEVLNDIAAEMGKYFRVNPVRMNRLSFIRRIILGIIMMRWAIFCLSGLSSLIYLS